MRLDTFLESRIEDIEAKFEEGLGCCRKSTYQTLMINYMLLNAITSCETTQIELERKMQNFPYMINKRDFI